MEEKPLRAVDDREETLTEERLVPLYWVIMHNDPVTTMDFVVMILVRAFGIDEPKAEALMMEIHNTGQSRVALMPLERAEFKVEQIHRAARAQDFPLTCTVEPE